MESLKIRPTASDDSFTGLVLTVTPAKFKDTDQLLLRLWDLEETLESSAVTQYLDEYVRLPSGRYQVSLLWKSQECRELGESRSQALRRFLKNERAPFRKDKLKFFNQVVLVEYETMGHAKNVPQKNLCQNQNNEHIIYQCMVFSSPH